MVGTRLERVEKPVGPSEPAPRDRVPAVEVELVRGQPGRKSSNRGGVAAPPVEEVRTLPRA